MDYKLAVFIGRFQPVHNSHLEVIRQGLKVADRVLIIIGSAHASSNIKNPFSAEDRESMIVRCLNSEEMRRVSFEYIRDYYYSENSWITDVQTKARHHYKDGDSVALLGSYKDSSSYYLKHFPQFDFIPAKHSAVLNSTDIRNILFDATSFQDDGWQDKGSGRKLKLVKEVPGLPPSVLDALQEVFISTDAHHSLIKEFEFIKKYKAQWESSPFPPTFVTVDAVVVQSGHVLLVRRKFEPGKGLLALPGGFIKKTEAIEQAAVRELKEETGIKVHAANLKRSIEDNHVFDHPDRSLRGRTITHAYYFKLEGDELPEVRGNDDAAVAEWIPLMDLGRLESEFYEDHFHIVNFFLNR